MVLFPSRVGLPSRVMSVEELIWLQYGLVSTLRGDSSICEQTKMALTEAEKCYTVAINFRHSKFKGLTLWLTLVLSCASEHSPVVCSACIATHRSPQIRKVPLPLACRWMGQKRHVDAFAVSTFLSEF